MSHMIVLNLVIQQLAQSLPLSLLFSLLPLEAKNDPGDLFSYIGGGHCAESLFPA